MFEFPRFIRNTPCPRLATETLAIGAAALAMGACNLAGAQTAGSAAPATFGAAIDAVASQPAMPAAAAPDYSGDLTGDWFGLRPNLQKKGFTFSGSLITDGSYDLSGGLATRRSAYRSLLTFNISFDTKTLLGLPGGTVFASYEGLWGQNGTATNGGSLQPYDVLDAAPFSALYQLYYDQMFNQLLEVRVGRQDASDFFAEPPDAQTFINNSPTAFPTLIGSPFYPLAALGIVTALNPNGPLILKLGAYYFDRFHPSALDQAFNTLEPTGQPVGTFFIAEGDYNWRINGTLPGVVALGGTWRTGQLSTLGGSVQAGGGSVYSYVDQTLWTDPANQSLAAFATLMAADRRVNAIDFASQGGFVFTGLMPDRPSDQLGLDYNWAHISSQANLPKPYELIFEGFYSFNFGHGVTLQPDLQYFVHDGGGTYPDALVATIRLSLNF
ncbi:MAG: carbohydrate porin [Phycisphaerae bacterium]